MGLKRYPEEKDTMGNDHCCDHVGIFTNNAAKLVNFYTGKFPFKKIKHEILSQQLFKKIFGTPIVCNFIRLASGKVMLEIFEPIHGHAVTRKKNSSGINHWGYCVNNREQFVQKLRRKRVRLITLKRNSHRVYFAVDPDGNRIEIRSCNT